jgi:hypothetical protein
LPGASPSEVRSGWAPEHDDFGRLFSFGETSAAAAAHVGCAANWSEKR